MAHKQQSLDLNFNVPAEPPESLGIQEEVASVWGLPIGKFVELNLRTGSIRTLRGKLELNTAPDFPWNAKEVLNLKINKVSFRSRDIEHWRLV